ncbi:interleukin-15 isoform X2 [Amia ocellicauda]|uniref:interleukin-15 isoform X2 n=1 Tax=Amia ocellicauda TaxID=2972642 RepID=UPI003463B66D
MSAFLILLSLTFIKLVKLHRDSSSKKCQVRKVYVSCYFHLFLERSPNSEAWISLFILSCLSADMPITEANQNLIEMQIFLNKSLSYFNKSTAYLYTPEIPTDRKCVNVSFQCYILEMEVIIFELENKDCVYLSSVCNLEGYLSRFKEQIDNELIPLPQSELQKM